MSLTSRLVFWTRATLGRARMEREMEREMRQHVDREREELIRRGVVPAEADRLAHVAFGGRAKFREAARDERRVAVVEHLARDVGYAARTLRRSPGFAVTAVLTLALGIGATTVIFSVTDNVVLRGLPYPNADRLVALRIVSNHLANVTPTWPPNAARYLAWKAGCTLCEQVAAVRPMQPLTLSGAGEPTRISVVRASDNLLSMLGAPVERGRLFAPGEDAYGGPPLIVITDALWREQLGARPDIIGHSITLDAWGLSSSSWTVIGVLAPGFRMLRGAEMGALANLPRRTAAFVPLALTPREQRTQGEHDYGVIALRKPGVTVAQLRAQLDAINARVAAQLRDDTPTRTDALPLQTRVVGDARAPLLLLLAAVGAVLLIVCVNLANLLLARRASRRRELAVRVALGAGRGRLVQQALAETVLVALAGGGVALVLARWGVRALVALAPADLPRVDEIQLDGRVLAMAVGLSVVVGLAFGLVPALRSAAVQPGDALRDGGSRSATEGQRATRARAWLIGSQIGLSTVLLVAAGLFLESFVRVLHVDRGFTAERVLALDVAPPRSAFPTEPSRARFYEQTLSRLTSLRGVRQAAVTNALPLEGEAWIDGIVAPGQSRETEANFRFVSPSYFEAMGLPLVRGRAFGDADRGRQVMVLSERAANALWPGEDPIGRMAQAGTDTAAEVVGVVPDVPTTGLEREGSLVVYKPYWTGFTIFMTLVLRTTGDPAGVAAPARAAIHDLSPTVPVSNVRTMRQVLSASVARRRFELVLLGLFALTALLTASIGIYGIISSAVARRASEMGIRIALGARPMMIHSLILREGLTPVAAGLAGGIVASVAVGRAMRGLLFQVTPWNPVVLAAVAALLGVVAVVACLIPSRRAVALGPMVLRGE